MANQFIFASAKSRRNLAQWLAKIPADRASALLAAAGARSIHRLHPSRFVSVVEGVRRELAAKSPPLAESSGGEVSIFGLAEAIGASVKVARQANKREEEAEQREREEQEERDREEREERLAPWRDALDEAERSFHEARNADDAASVAVRSARKEMLATGEKVYPAYIKAFDAQDANTHTRAQFDSAVAAYDSAYESEETAKAVYRAANDRKDAAHGALRNAGRVRDAAYEALRKAEAESV